MNWEEKIKEGMKLIKEGCSQQGSWNGCCECPFDNYCTACYSTDQKNPEEWEVEK